MPDNVLKQRMNSMIIQKKKPSMNNNMLKNKNKIKIANVYMEVTREFVQPIPSQLSPQGSLFFQFGGSFSHISSLSAFKITTASEGRCFLSVY